MSTITKEQIESIWGLHPARTLSFSDLYAGLNEQVEQRNVNRVSHGSLELFNYTSHAVFKSDWGLYTLIARGLILNPGEQRVIATPFPKFFNYGEAQIWGADDIAGKVHVATKYDGSLGIAYWHEDQWHVATRGAFASEQAVWATAWLRNNLPMEKLNPSSTYLFEIIFPENQIVVRYAFSGLVLLGIYDASGEEAEHSRLQTKAKRLGIRVAEQRAFQDVDQLILAAGELPRDEEGWVIRFANGHRLKIKGVEYCRIHRILSRITPLALWEMLLAEDDFDAVRKEIPEEHRWDFDEIETRLGAQLEALFSEIEEICRKRCLLENKEIGLAFKAGRWDDGDIVTSTERKFIFGARNEGFPEKRTFDADSRFRKMIFQTIRPKKNELLGYIPSNAMNRFQEETK